MMAKRRPYVETKFCGIEVSDEVACFNNEEGIGYAYLDDFV